ncbi:MAG: aminotransferase class I/II-fold pyridoxal phosphate-dependent enzyme [Lachnospiraceae bacterium]|nr:aminotransferase class I/II-fold pyridoxal phosphate-dependent enzyme [Lachnospiraceae bacterium]
MGNREEHKRIYLSSPTMHGDEQRFVQEAFDTNWVAPLGPNVDAFEQEICAYTKAGYAAALDSGTAAIHLALKLAGVQEGDIVFAPSLTFSATCNPIMYEKAVPVFIDCEPDTWNMSPQALEQAFKKYPQAKAVIAVYLYGTPAKIDELMEICKRHNVPYIEDAAESLGASYKGKQTGTFGTFGIYSFNGNKIITTSGGGMLVSDDQEAIARARFFATQARDKARHYQHSQIGYNYRMSNITAGVGRGQLLHLDEHIALKKAIYERYKEAFADIEEIAMNPMDVDGEANYWLSCMIIREDSRVTPDMVMDRLEEYNIETRPIWKPMHLQPVFAEYDFFTHDGGEESVSQHIFDHGLCLPSDIKNTPEDMEQIIGLVRGLFGKE